MRASFDPYYAAGQAMAKAYVAEGPAGGNKMMGAFDGTAEAITEAVAAAIEEERRLVEADRAELARDIVVYESAAHQAESLSILAATFVVVGLGTAALAFLALVLKPLTGIAGVVAELGAGRSVDAVPGHGRQDEIGAIARAVAELDRAAAERRRVAATRVAEAEAAAEKARQQAAAVSDFRATVTALMQDVDATMSGMHGTASALGDVAQNCTQKAQETASSSEEASQSVQSVSAATDQLASSIAEISSRVTQTTGVVRDAAAGPVPRRRRWTGSPRRPARSATW